MEIGMSDSGTVEIRDITGKVTRIAFDGAPPVVGECIDPEQLSRRNRVALFVNPHDERGQYWLDNWNEFEIMECQFDIDERESDIAELQSELSAVYKRLKELQARNAKEPQMVLFHETESIAT